MNVPDDLLYTESHEWIKREDDKIRVGITDHAQAELTDVVFVELPKIDRQANAKEAIAVVESVKAASDSNESPCARMSAKFGNEWAEEVVPFLTLTLFACTSRSE